MDIIVITPARPASSSGNWVTSVRWTRILRRAQAIAVRIASQYEEPARPT